MVSQLIHITYVPEIICVYCITTVELLHNSVIWNLMSQSHRFSDTMVLAGNQL